MPFLAIALLCLLFVMTAARADTFDVADLKCSDLVDSYPEQFVVIDAWLSGYYHGKSNSTLVNPKQIAENTAKVVQFCKANPDLTVMKAIERLTAQSAK
jgi:hypothetical protein